MVNHNDGHATHWPCCVCAVTGPSEAGESASLHKLIGDLQNTLAQATMGMAALANGLWNGHTTPLNAASSIGSVLDAVSMPPVKAHGHTALGQPGHEGGCGCGGHQHSSGMDPCHICKQVGQQVDESDQRGMEAAIRSVTCHHVLWSIRAR